MTEHTYPEIDEAIKDFEIRATYIPFDVGTLDKKPADPNYHGKGRIYAEDLNKLQLRYTVEVFYKGRLIMTTPYSMGIGHIPKDSVPPEPHGWTNDKLAWITEVMKTGKAGKWNSSGFASVHVNAKPIEPEKRAVIWCLLMDGQEAINAAGFEDWAADYGYDTDSRKAEQTYRACLEIGLKLRAALGDTKMQELMLVYQDY